MGTTRSSPSLSRNNKQANNSVEDPRVLGNQYKRYAQQQVWVSLKVCWARTRGGSAESLGDAGKRARAMSWIDQAALAHVRSSKLPSVLPAFAFFRKQLSSSLCLSIQTVTPESILFAFLGPSNDDRLQQQNHSFPVYPRSAWPHD